MSRKRLAIPVAAAAVLTLLALLCLPARAQNADSQEIAALFSEMKMHASQAEDDADRLETYTRSNIHWRTHAEQLRLTKEHVNDLLRDYSEMGRLREKGSPWQQDAIDQLSPVLKELAAHLTATISQQNETPQHVRIGPYVDYVRENREYASKASTLIHDLADYGAAMSRAQALERRLNLQPDTN